MTQDIEHLFIHLPSTCISSLVRCQFKFFVHFLIRSIFLMSSFKSCLFCVTVLYQMCLLQIFSQYVAHPTILFTLSFTEQKVLILIKSSLSIITFKGCVLVLYPKKSLPYSGQQGCLCYFPEVLQFCILHFRSMIYFELTVVKGIRSVSRSIFSACGCSHPSAIWWRHFTCSIILPLLLCQRTLAIFMWVYFQALPSVPLIHLSVTLPLPHGLN